VLDQFVYANNPEAVEETANLVEGNRPSVAVSGRLFVALTGAHGVRTLLGQQFETFQLDVGDQGGARPRRQRQQLGGGGGGRGRRGLRPVGSTARPQPGAAERRSDFDDVAVLHAQPDLGRVRYHLHRAAAALVRRRRHQRLEPRADLARRQVPGRRDELDPQRHGPLAAVAELQDGAAGQRAVVDEVEDAHLVEIERHLELGRRQDAQSVVLAAAGVRQRADEARLLRLDLAQHVLYALAHLADRLGDGHVARHHAVVVELVQLEQKAALSRQHRPRRRPASPLHVSVASPQSKTSTAASAAAAADDADAAAQSCRHAHIVTKPRLHRVLPANTNALHGPLRFFDSSGLSVFC